MLVILSSGFVCKVKEFQDLLCVAVTPFYIYVKKEFKSSIIAALSRHRGHPSIESSTNVQWTLLQKPMTLEQSEFVHILRVVGVTSVVVRQFGMRAKNMKFGQHVMIKCRTADRDCYICYDLAWTITAHLLHYGNGTRHMPKLELDDSLTPLDKYVVLCHIQNTQSLRLAFGESVRIEHLPKDIAVQLLLTRLKHIPPLLVV